MRKGFLFALAAIMVLALPGCKKDSKSYEAIYYILMSGPTQVTCSNSETKQKLEIAIQDWKNSTTLTWRVNFGTSYTDADVAEKDTEAVNYFNERVTAFENAIKPIRNSLNSAIDHNWHFSICRDRSSNTLAPSKDVSIVYHP